MEIRGKKFTQLLLVIICGILLLQMNISIAANIENDLLAPYEKN